MTSTPALLNAITDLGMWIALVTSTTLEGEWLLRISAENDALVEVSVAWGSRKTWFRSTPRNAR